MDRPRVHFSLASFCLIMGVIVPAFVVGRAIFKEDHRMSAPEAVYEFVRTKGDLSSAQLKTVSEGVRFAHEHYWGSSGREVLYFVYPLAFLVLAAIHLSAGFSRVKPEANQSQQPTAPSGRG